MSLHEPKKEAGPDEDRIFARPGKIYRSRFSVREPAVGLAILSVLCAIAAWISYRGARPRPELTAAAPLPDRSPAPVQRGPFPVGLAPDGWLEKRYAKFEADRIFEKIDGREGYYKSLGVRRLHCLTLESPGGDPAIDLELFELDSAESALGAASGELPATAHAELANSTLWSLDQNMLYFARGRFYLRAIGTSVAPEVRAALATLPAKLGPALPGEPLPWAYTLFVPLGVAPAKVSFQRENGFSFSFSDNLWTGLLPDGDTELFTVRAEDAAKAEALALKFSRGFAEQGSPLGQKGGTPWWKDRYLGRASAAIASGPLVLGIHGAADAEAGAALLSKVVEAARELPAVPAAGPPAAPAPAQRAEKKGGEP